MDSAEEKKSVMKENSAKEEFSPNSSVTNNSKIEEKDDECSPKIDFTCSVCQMHVKVHYFGQTPTFVHDIQFHEDTYVLRDPFQPPPSRWKAKAEYFIAIGANCNVCDKMVCKDDQCSFFYIRSYCLACARDNFWQFPVEIQQRLHK